ncbi:hypothetical protein IVB33_04330 [Bradyrhizobium sp. 24]|nr:hypothetical protein [Bradyrhizobium sp. 37]MCK1377638.1 hypothetical protein [Bradyrhizobium sp. 24]MCK1769118.1 hypothetical protein [Bradyrhizobium sp. 134]
MPGILDSHPHFLHTSAHDVWSVNLYDARDHADIVARIRTHVAQVPAGRWVMGDGHPGGRAELPHPPFLQRSHRAKVAGPSRTRHRSA